MNEDVTKVVVTERGGPETPLVAVPLPWWQVLLVRTTRTYLQTVVGLLAAAAVVPVGVVVGDPRVVGTGLSDAFVYALVAGMAPAMIALLQNSVELLSRIDQNAPGLRA